jgi:hypothetical protein
MTAAMISGGHLRTTSEPKGARAFLATVPTPFRGENHSSNSQSETNYW